MIRLVGNTDPSGEVGRRVAERLAARGFRQRLIVSDDVHVSGLPHSQVGSVSSYGDFDSMKEAATGVETLFSYRSESTPSGLASI